MLQKLKNIEKVGDIPKIIWSYWDNGIENAGYIVNKSYLSWKKYHPDYEVIFLNNDNLNKYINIEKYFQNINFEQFDHFSKVKKADLIRCVLLSEYGGIWIDSSLILTESLDWLLKSDKVLLDGFPTINTLEPSNLISKNNKKIICFYHEGFTRNSNFPLIENWFIAVSKNNKFMSLWKEEFYKYLKIGFDDYYYKEINEKIDLENFEDNDFNPAYLTMHVCAQKIIQENPELLEEMYYLYSSFAPFKLHYDCKWDMYEVIKNIFEENDISVPKMIKFRGYERNLFDEYIKEDKKYSEKSLYFKYIKNL